MAQKMTGVAGYAPVMLITVTAADALAEPVPVWGAYSESATSHPLHGMDPLTSLDYYRVSGEPADARQISGLGPAIAHGLAASASVIIDTMTALSSGAADSATQEMPGEGPTGDIGSADEDQENQEYYIQIESYNSTQNARVNELKQEFKNDIRDLLDHADTEEYGGKSNELLTEYDEFFRVIIENSRISTNTEVLSEPEILAVIDYIFHETIKDEKRKIARESYPAEEIQNIGFLEMFGIPTADAACQPTTTPRFKQHQIDIDGGRYGIYAFNGDNGMYRVESNNNPKTCATEYTLYFHDEDHPYLDSIYDDVRLDMYGRIHDIESFTIHNNNRIEFDYTWSSNNRYDCLIIFVGCHATTTKSYSQGQTIYVSNTWNHMMDTSDTNRSLPSVFVR